MLGGGPASTSPGDFGQRGAREPAEGVLPPAWLSKRIIFVPSTPLAPGRGSASVRRPLRAGDWTLRELEGAASEIASWRASLTDTSRYCLTAAFRQSLGAGVRWRYLRINPVVEAGKNPQPRTEDCVSFTRTAIDALDAEPGPVYGPLVVFAAETGLRTNEWAALERRDVDMNGQAVVVQRRVTDGVVTPYPKTERSRRRVPLTDRALVAYRRLLARLDTTVVFPAPAGGYLNLDNFRTREW